MADVTVIILTKNVHFLAMAEVLDFYQPSNGSETQTFRKVENNRMTTHGRKLAKKKQTIIND